MKSPSSIFHGTTSPQKELNSYHKSLVSNIKKIPGINITDRKITKGKKVLISDDDAAIVDVLTLMLEMAGYNVYASENGQTITDVNRFLPDLILLDILMSGINGYDICKELKKQQSTKHIPVIIISADKDATVMAAKACADDFIIKPFEMHKLLQKVTKHIYV